MVFSELQPERGGQKETNQPTHPNISKQPPRAESHGHGHSSRLAVICFSSKRHLWRSHLRVAGRGARLSSQESWRRGHCAMVPPSKIPGGHLSSSPPLLARRRAHWEIPSRRRLRRAETSPVPCSRRFFFVPEVSPDKEKAEDFLVRVSLLLVGASLRLRLLAGCLWSQPNGQRWRHLPASHSSLGGFQRMF